MHEDEILVKQGKLLRFNETLLSVDHHKHFVFDLDETIGSFRELYTLWKSSTPTTTVENSENFLEKDSDSDRLVRLLRLFPEFLRPGILPILQYLYQKKQQHFFGQFYIYTNNQCGRFWTESVVQAIEVVAETPHLVDHIICAFKIDNVIVESCRTSHWKTWNDFIRCTLLPQKAMICFIDDTYFPKMNRDRVFYLQPRPYQHKLGFSEIAQRLMSTSSVHASTTLIQTWFAIKPSTASSAIDDDLALSKRLLYYIREFFHMTLRRPHTRKVKGRFWYNLTQKKRR